MTSRGATAVPAPPRGALTEWSGAGLVFANMVGAGVLLSTGFMAQEMGPGAILLSWVVGALIALSGAWAYGAVASAVARSGGEYRYLSELVHPFLGYLAGWGSLVLGFSAPIAVDALAVGEFSRTLGAAWNPRLLGAAVVVALTALQCLDLVWAKWSQNVLLAVKIGFIVWFVAVGMALGSRSWPTWQPPGGGTELPWRPFLANQYWIVFAFSGWNAAIYAAEEFRRPRQQVARAMVIGASTVAVLYLLVNWIFVANLTPVQAQAVFEYESARITLGHLIAVDLLGPGGGTIVSMLVIAAFVSAMSAMMLVGPRVYAAMAADGFLPRWFANRAGRAPVGSVLAQGALALTLIFTHTLLAAVQAAAVFLMAFTALTALSLWRVAARYPDLPPPSLSRRFAGLIHAAAMLGIMGFGLRSLSRPVWVSVATVILLGAAAYAGSKRRTHA